MEPQCLPIRGNQRRAGQPAVLNTAPAAGDLIVCTHLPAGQRRTPAPEAALTPQGDPVQPPLSHAGSAGKPTCDPSSQLKPYVGDLRLSKLAGWTMAGEDSVTVDKPQVAGVV